MLTDGNFDQASARIRAIQYIPLFEEFGYCVSLIPRIPIKPENLILKYTWFPLMKRIFWIKRFFALYFFHWDVIFVQRIFIAELVLKKVILKSKLIFDFDDAIYLNSSDLTAQMKTELMIRYAHHVIISSPWLNEFCLRQGKNGEVIPTPVETDLILPSSREANIKPVIGWIGSSWTTGYLKQLEPVLQQLSNEIDFEFLTIGARPEYSVKGVNHKNLKWEFGIEPKALAKMDIGIMPLPDDDYARAKGGYKIYLYMAAGIPSVASPVGVNKLIIRNGENGFLATSESDWLQKLKLIITDKQLTNRMGVNSRHQAVKLYDRKVCFSQLIKIIEQSNP
jgi:glycosyltransferase involved in cell wall biosynthesis